MSSPPPGSLDAAAAAHTAVQLAPDSLEHRLTLAGLLLRAGNVAGAILHYEIAALIAAGPNVEVAVGLAQALTTAGLHEDAERLRLEVERAGLATPADRERLRTALPRRPELAAEMRAAALRLLEEGDRLQSAGQPQQALALFIRAAQLLPGLAPLHYRIGCLLQDFGSAEPALSHYELAARAQPTLFGAAHNAGKLAAGFGQVERARRYLGQAHGLRPQDGLSMQLELVTPAIHDSTESIARALPTGPRSADRGAAAYRGPAQQGRPHHLLSGLSRRLQSLIAHEARAGLHCLRARAGVAGASL